VDWFKEEPTGTLVAMEPAEFTGMTYYIWFPYAWGYMREVLEGSFVTVRSFASTERKTIYSILEIVSVFPKHYALGSSVSETEKAFPGFVVEAAKSAKQDWEQKTPTEETTKIKTEAIPTGLQFYFEDDEPKIERDESLPMVGEEAFLLTDEFINMIVNQGLLNPSIPTIAPCAMVLNPDVNIRIDVEQLLRTHFGIFGFTGSGKSNLVSTIIDNLLKTGTPIKIVLFDLMSEYVPLLIDELNTYEQAFVLSLDLDSIPGGDATLSYFEGRGASITEAATSISRTMLLPKELAPYRNYFTSCIQSLLKLGKFKVLDQGAKLPTAREVVASLEACIQGNIGSAEIPIRRWLEKRVIAEPDREMEEEDLEILRSELEDFVSAGKIPESFTTTPQTSFGPLRSPPVASGKFVELKALGRKALVRMEQELERILQRRQVRPPEAIRISLEEVLGILGSRDSSSLFIVQCDRDDELRIFVRNLIDDIFQHRRRYGINTPPILFVFDEADEFLPQKVSSGSSYAESRAAAAILARRGRKFGMGMAIATQRVAYLDTTILAQPHTYLVSKLPRKYDRDTMANAFGITEEMMRRSLKFSKGQWLLVSYDALGLENVPIPVQFPNANDRIISYLRSEKG